MSVLSVVSLFTLPFMSLSGGRESLLTREIEDLKSKPKTKINELDEAIKKVCTLHKT